MPLFERSLFYSEAALTLCTKSTMDAQFPGVTQESRPQKVRILRDVAENVGIVPLAVQEQKYTYTLYKEFMKMWIILQIYMFIYVLMNGCSLCELRKIDMARGRGDPERKWSQN